MIATAPAYQADAARHVANIAKFLNQAPEAAEAIASAKSRTLPVWEWGEQNYWIAQDSGRPRLISLLPHQKIILRLFFDESIARAFNCHPNFQTLVYSTVKKSGKTAIAGLVARWIAETWGSHVEVYSMANDLEQARGRIYAAALASIELDPRYALGAKGIPGLWRVIEREAAYVPTHSSIRAVSSDYKGEAGSNPVATFWSELWGYEKEASIRLWEELTPVPTRPRSIRYVETYAGYEGESSILNDLEDRIKKEGRRLTHDELNDFGMEWPWPDQPLPFFVHLPSRTMAYWDEGEIARRMPWQTPDYYVAQKADLRPQAYERLHLNHRVSTVDEFIPIEWWDRLRVNPAPILDHDKPVVLGLDASVTGDCSAAAVIGRDPSNANNVIHYGGRVWTPEGGRALDYSVTIEPFVRQLTTGHIHPLHENCKSHSKLDMLGECHPTKPYNVVQIAYDPFQLHDLMTRIRNEGLAWCKPFGQQADRSVADKAFFDLIRDQRIHHSGDDLMRDHIKNCGAKIPKDDNTRMRLVKKAAKAKIDYAVASSMAANECLRMNLW